MRFMALSSAIMHGAMLIRPLDFARVERSEDPSSADLLALIEQGGVKRVPIPDTFFNTDHLFQTVAPHQVNTLFDQVIERLFDELNDPTAVVCDTWTGSLYVSRKTGVLAVSSLQALVDPRFLLPLDISNTAEPVRTARLVFKMAQDVDALPYRIDMIRVLRAVLDTSLRDAMDIVQGRLAFDLTMPALCKLLIRMLDIMHENNAQAREALKPHHRPMGLRDLFSLVSAEMALAA